RFAASRYGAAQQDLRQGSIFTFWDLKSIADWGIGHIWVQERTSRRFGRELVWLRESRLIWYPPASGWAI
ncbi:MAG TPA: hypothetical protein VH744_11240, partial [Terriglobales bacterium]